MQIVQNFLGLFLCPKNIQSISTYSQNYISPINFSLFYWFTSLFWRKFYQIRTCVTNMSYQPEFKL